MMKAKIDYLLTERLEKVYDPFSMLGLSRETLTLQVQMGSKDPVVDHAEYTDRNESYHVGRVRYFVERLLLGGHLTPVVLDNACAYGHVYPELVVLDGHHRMCAYLLAGRARVPASYSGRVDFLRYLCGASNKRPE